MNTHTRSALFIALACATPVLFAQETSQPPAELDQFSVFFGNWQCNGQFLAHGSSPGHATTAVGHGTKSVGGRWIQFAYEENKTIANPTPYSTGGYMGFDADKKQFVSTSVDNFGNYGPSFSAGWKGDTLTFEGTTHTADGKSIVSRDNFVRKGPNEFVHFSQSQGPDGKWVKPDEESCHTMK